MTGGPNPNPNPTSMAILSPRSLTLTLILILILILALSPFLSAAPLPHPSPSPARRPSPPQKHPPPSHNSHPCPPLHPKPTPPLKSHPSPPHQPHPHKPLPLTKSPATLNANPNTIHVGHPSNQQHPPCSTPGQNCHNEIRLPLRNAPPGPPPPPSLRKGRLNFGKRLGLLFSGIGVLLQIGLGSFLAFKRWQLKMLEDGPQVTRSGRRRLRVSSSASSS